MGLKDLRFENEAEEKDASQSSSENTVKTTVYSSSRPLQNLLQLQEYTEHSKQQQIWMKHNQLGRKQQ